MCFSKNLARHFQLLQFFPAFQKTNGDLVDVTANDPVAVTSLCDTTQTALGRVRLDGYMLTSDSEYYLGKKSQVHDRDSSGGQSPSSHICPSQ